MNQAVLAAWALRVLLTLSPLTAPREALPGWAETPWERGVRYVAIASDVAAAADEACGSRGEGCRRWAVAVLLGVAWHESGFAADVDAGRCYRGRDGKGPRCDGGRAWGLWQMQGSGDEGKAWARDRRAGAREALRRIGRSLRACRRLPREEALSAYAGGRCEGAEAARRARELHAAVTRALAVR